MSSPEGSQKPSKEDVAQEEPVRNIVPGGTRNVLDPLVDLPKDIKDEGWGEDRLDSWPSSKYLDE